MSMLDLLRRRKAAGAPDERPPMEALKGTIGQIGQLPMLPEAAHKAMAIVNDPRSSLAQFALVIEKDLALATGVLKLANSPLYRVGRAIDTVNQAVLRLGMRECQNLIIAVGMRSMFSKIPRAQKERCEGLWAHSFMTACLCRHLNKRLKFGYTGEEFACGLAHDFGRLLIVIAAPALSLSADPMDFTETPELLDHETAVLGTDHCYLGAWFANLNRLPPTILSAIQHHHTPLDATEHQNLVGMVATADDMANYIQREGKIEGYDPTGTLGWYYLTEELGHCGNFEFAEEAPTIMEDALKEAEGAKSSAA